MPLPEPDDDNDPRRYPVFYLPEIPPAEDPIHLPTSLIPEFRHKDHEYKLLCHLWHVQLGNVQYRHHWNVQALHDFWRTCGPRTFEGRYYGWTSTWVVDALFSLRRDLDRLQKVADSIMLRRARMQAQARQILERVGIQLEDEGWVSKKEVKLAVELAREDVGDEGCVGDEQVMIKKLLRDRAREREQEEAKERGRLGARGGGRRRSRSRARLGSSDSEATDESPTHKPPPARKRPTSPPVVSAIDASERAREADAIADRQWEPEQRWESLPPDSIPKEGVRGPLPPMDMEIRVSEYEVASGSDSEPERLRAQAA
ncbi:hypothetical protein GX51_03974 [Blastomyces parvus]|uniref:Uncharacterized protein n=1 Tax=Blastomyces parvus TaxID=2060905 RepID=A0A2B7X3T4_9EURO|nr:hypothetical protein GX51_03974 [Blastomyces parvus]